MEAQPISIFSMNTSLRNCLGDIPCMMRMPNSLFRVFKNEPTEYKMKKKENTINSTCDTRSPIIPSSLSVSLEDWIFPFKSGWNKSKE